MQQHHSTTDLAIQRIVLSKALLKVVDNFKINRNELCQILGISEASASRLFNGVRQVEPDSKEGELTLLFLRTCRSLDALFGGNQEQCRLWLRSFNNYLVGVPIESIKHITGLVATANYLDAMRGKV